MQFRGDRRGQAIQIGAVLLLGAVVLAFSIYQATVVPEQNREIEFKHSQTVQEQLTDVRNAVLSTGSTGDSRSVSVTLGTQYPSRVIALNPSPPSGTLSTVGTTNESINVTVANARASGETGDFWTGANRSYNTGALVHRPSYNEYQGAPTTWYENSMLFNEFNDANLSISEQRLVDDDQISLVTLNGSYYASRSGGVSVDLRSVSTSSRAVSLTNATVDSNVTLTVPTRLSQRDWEDALADEEHVTAIETTAVSGSEYQLLHVVLEQGVRYDLQVTRVGVGTNVVRPSAAYLTRPADTTQTVPEGGETELTVEVRDELDNPKRDVRVIAGTRWDNASVAPNNVTSDGEGRVTVTYEAPADISGASQRTDHVQVSLNTSLSSAVNGSSFNGSTAVNVTVPVRVDNSDGSGLGGGGDGAYATTWADPSSQEGVTCDESTCTINGSETTTVNLTAQTSPTAQNASVEFALNDSSIGTFSQNETTTNSTGQATTTYTADSNGSVATFVSSGGSGDQLDLVVENVSTASRNFQTTIDNTNSPVVEGETLQVDATIDNTGTQSDTQTIELYYDDTGDGTANTLADSQQVTLGSGASQSITLEWATTTGDAGDVAIRVTSDDDADTDTVTVEQTLQGDAVQTSNNVFEFTIENTGAQQVTIEQFSIDTTAITPGNDIDDGNAPEVEIRGGQQDGEANRGKNQNPSSFEADGTVYDLVADSNKGNDGQYAILNSGDRPTVDMRAFAQRLDNGGSNPLQFTNSAADADVIVTFVLSDGTEQVFYFEQQ